MTSQERRCLNCGHRMSLHWTLTTRCQRASECLCQRWMAEWPVESLQRASNSPGGTDEYHELDRSFRSDRKPDEENQ